MFKNYIATKRDLIAVEKALGFVLHTKMKFVFSDLSKITKTLVVSYDSKFVYMWSLDPIKLTKIPHNLTIPDEWQYAWRAAIWDKKIEVLLPSRIQKSTHFEIPRISGGLFTPFVELQKKIKGEKNNPYITKESYLATIVHEFGHVYWNSFKMWWPSDKKENLSYLVDSLKLCEAKTKNMKVQLRFPTFEAIGEVFAFCTEYYASSFFWPHHRKLIVKSDKAWIKILIKEEKTKDLEREDSVLEPTKNPHHFARVFSRIILNKFPENWPTILTDHTRIMLHL